MRTKWTILMMIAALLVSLTACSSNTDERQTKPAKTTAVKRANDKKENGKKASEKARGKALNKALSRPEAAKSASACPQAGSKSSQQVLRCLPRVNDRIRLAADYGADLTKVQARLLEKLIQNLAEVRKQTVCLEVTMDPDHRRFFQPDLPGRHAAYLYAEYADGFEYVKRVCVQVKARPKAMAERFAPKFAPVLNLSPAELAKSCTPPAPEADPEFDYDSLLGAHQDAKLPKGTKINLIRVDSVDFASPGVHEGLAEVRYPDRSLDQVPVQVRIPLWGKARQAKLRYQDAKRPLPVNGSDQTGFQELLGQAILANYEAVKDQIHDLLVMNASESYYEDFQTPGSKLVSVKAMFTDGSVEAKGHRVKILVRGQKEKNKKSKSE